MRKSYVISDVELLGIMEALYFACDKGFSTQESRPYTTELGREGLSTFLSKRGVDDEKDPLAFAYMTTNIYNEVTMPIAN